MKNRGFLKEQSVLSLLSQNNFIVPEIQREYVWGKNPNVLIPFLRTLKNKAGTGCSECGNPKTNARVNIGFLYTYKPSYVIFDQERFLDENLIDGQQRFTTLFLLLYYSSLKEIRREDFLDLIRYKELLSMGFDYRVRSLTHSFLLELVDKCRNIDDISNLFNNSLTWVLKDYLKDPSITAIIEALKTIDVEFRTSSVNYYDFILNNVKFYHFRTEATNQGEELYITMNARGEALSKNEEVKATLMIQPDQIYEHGIEWEKWQDFFWENRDKSDPLSNADKGFNEFLRWVQIIEMAESTTVNTEEDEKIEDEGIKNIIKLIQADTIDLDKKYFPLQVIKKYFDAMEYLFKDFRASFIDLQNKYQDINEFDLLPKMLLHPKNGNIEQMDCFKLLPVIYYCKKILEEKQKINDHQLFRLIRFLNNLKDDKTIRKTVNKQVINALKIVNNLLGVSDDISEIVSISSKEISKSILTTEERFKFLLYKTGLNRELLEQSFWIAEDSRLNKGKIGHLIQASFSNADSITDFQFLRDFSNCDVQKFNLTVFNHLYLKFNNITNGKENISDDIWTILLLTEYYTETPWGGNNIVFCQGSENENVIYHKSFLKHLFLIKESQNTNDYFETIRMDFFNQYNSIEEIIAEEDSKRQIYIYQMTLKDINRSLWYPYWKGKNFGVYKMIEFDSYFKNKYRFQLYRQRWQGADYNFFEDSKELVSNYILNNISFS